MKQLKEMIDSLGITPGMVAILLVVIIVILIIFLIKVSIDNHKLKKRMSAFMTGRNAKNLEETINELAERVNTYESGYKEVVEKYDTYRLGIRGSYKKMGVVRYDAFKGMKGKLSFALCILDDFDSGFMMNNMKSADGNYTYLKEIIHGKCSQPLGKEEQQALEDAMNCEKFE